MSGLLSLWLPILVSAVAIFIASFLAWVVLPHHKPDFKGLPDEDGVVGPVKAANLAPGVYMFPWCGNDHNNPEYARKAKEGPNGVLHVWAGQPNMGKNLGLSMAFYLLVSVIVAYVGTISLGPGVGFMEVFRLTGTVAIMAYALGAIPNAIWFQKPGRAMLMDFVDGVAFGLITGAIFGWLWPATSVPGL